MVTSSRLPGFYKLSPSERLSTVLQATGLESGQLAAVVPADDKMLAIADRMIENVIGTLSVPLGVAANFRINDRDYLIPMATEEPSVVAAVSNMASVARIHGGFHASSDQPIMISQIEAAGGPAPHGAKMRPYERRRATLRVTKQRH